MTAIGDFISHEEFKQLYGPELAKKELVVLHAHDGDGMWQKAADGWHRLQGDERE